MTVIEQRQQQVKNYVSNNTQRKYDITSPAYQNFINSLKTQATKQTYSFMLNEYLVDNNIDLNTLLNLPMRDTEQLLINYIERAKSNDKSHSFLNNMFCAIKHFYIMNDIRINKIMT